MNHPEVAATTHATTRDGAQATRTGRLLVLCGPSGAGKTTIADAARVHGLVPVSHAKTRAPRPGECPGTSGAVFEHQLGPMWDITVEKFGKVVGWSSEEHQIRLLMGIDFVLTTTDFVTARLASRRFNGRLILVHRGCLDEAELRAELGRRQTPVAELEMRILDALHFYERLSLLRMVVDGEIVNDGALEDLPCKVTQMVRTLWPAIAGASR